MMRRNNYARSNAYQGHLISIHSAEKQDFVSKWLFTELNLIENVWIGAKYNDLTKRFQWSDSSEWDFTDWWTNNPTNRSDYNCIEIVPDSEPDGKWVNKPCALTNVVVCEKGQVWSDRRIVSFIVDSKREIDSLKKQLADNSQNKQ